MNRQARDIVIVGQGAAGLAAAVVAAQTARAYGVKIRITLIDKAPESEAGGNTRWSPSNMRMASPEQVEPSFVRDMLTATQFRGDEAYFARVAQEAPVTAEWLKSHGIQFIQPPYYLSKGPPRIQPLGGGANLIKVLTNAAKQAGVTFRYDCCARAIEIKDDRIAGVAIEHAETSDILPADAIVLTCGGFQGNAAMMREHLGDGGETMRLISPGTRFNTGDGINMALRIGADKSGDWSGIHCEPVDGRSKNSAPVVLIYPYGIVIDKTGHRFFDEGSGLMHETWEWLARYVHFKTPGSIAYAVFDSQLFEIPDYHRAIRSEVEPARAYTLPELAKTIGVEPEGLVATIVAYNAACTGDPSTFDATCCDGLAAAMSLRPAKSNWARAVSVPPYLAYPLVGAVAYTFASPTLGERSFRVPLAISKSSSPPKPRSGAR